jgi:hypothetical protein
MSLSNKLLLTFSFALVILLTGCGLGSSGIRITEGEKGPTTATGPTYDAGTPIIVHVDLFARIATIRNGFKLQEGFLIASDFAGIETSVLKMRPSSIDEGLTTADILEGEPSINNAIHAANPTLSSQLANIYRDPSEEN